MKKALLLLSLALFISIIDAYCQSKTVKGRLTNSNGEPIPGVNIVIKGTTLGTVTDLNGNYSIEAPIGSVLVFSSVGFTTQEMSVSGETNKNDTEKSPQSKEAPDKTNFESAPVLSADPTGTATLNPVSPQYVVMNYGNSNEIGDLLNKPFNYYNFPYYVYDVKSISKKEAWKKYHLPSHNGYFLIDSRYTKRFGVRVDYNASVVFNKYGKLPSLQKSFAQGRPENGHPTWRGPETGEILSWGPKLSNLEFNGESYPYDNNGQLTSLGTGDGIPAKAYNPYDFFKTGHTTNHSVDLSFHYLEKWFADLGFGSIDDTGIIPNSRNESDFFKFEIEKKGDKFPGFKYHVNYTETQSVLASQGGNLANLFYGVGSTPPTFDNSNGLSGKHFSKNPSTYTTTEGNMRSYSPQLFANPYFIVNRNFNFNNEDNFGNYLNIDLKLNIFDLTYAIGYDRSNQHQHFSLFEAGQWSVPYISSFRKRKDENWYSRLNLSFDTHLGKNYSHRISGVVVGEFTNSLFHFERENITVGESPSEDQIKTAKRRSYNVTKKISYHFNNQIHFDLQNTIYFSNTLDDDKYLNPSVGLSANTYSMPYWLEFINSAKLFSSYSRSISELPVNHNNLEFNTLLSTSSQFREYFEYHELLYAPELSPEVSEKFEIGSEISFWYGSVQTGLIYYNYIRNNAIYPFYTGSEFSLINGADIRNSGFEAYMSLFKNLGSGLSWNFKLNFSRNRSLVQKIYPNNGEIPIAGFSDVHKSLIEGQPAGVLVGTKFHRNDDGELIIGEDGYPIMSNTTGIIGDPNPDWISGIENKLTWRGLGLSFLIAIKHGGDIWNGTQNVLNYHGTSELTGLERDTRDYIFQGVNEDGQRNSIPVNFADAELPLNENRWVRYGLTGVAEEAIEDGSWIRMKELGIHYEIPRNVIDHLYISKIKISAFAENLFIISKYKGVDPYTSMFGYTNTDGLDLFNIPGIRSYGLGLNITL